MHLKGFERNKEKLHVLASCLFKRSSKLSVKENIQFLLYLLLLLR